MEVQLHILHDTTRQRVMLNKSKYKKNELHKIHVGRDRKQNNVNKN